MERGPRWNMLRIPRGEKAEMGRLGKVGSRAGAVGGDGGPVAAKEQKLLVFRRVCLWIFGFLYQLGDKVFLVILNQGPQDIHE